MERPNMVADGTYTAVLDRFEDTQEDDGDDNRVAVFLLEGDDGVVAEKLLSASELPEEARRQDAVCELRVGDGTVVEIEYDAEETERRVSDAQSRFDRLARRPNEGDGTRADQHEESLDQRDENDDEDETDTDPSSD
ncbi:DUF3006 family protein [Halorussus halophilus]|uniref:DUF3006 family protein n=1 Tax=Halorussus halophilus TaxID=2650975 RepID=UPI001CE48029|nr:DUF3006 family protein [Halorussus halophilus]